MYDSHKVILQVHRGLKSEFKLFTKLEKHPCHVKKVGKKIPISTPTHQLMYHVSLIKIHISFYSG